MLHAQITMSLPALLSLVASSIALGALIGLAIGGRALRRLHREREQAERTSLAEMHRRMGIE